MYVRFASFNSAVFLAAYVLLTADGSAPSTSLRDDPRCSSLSVNLDEEIGAAAAANGSFVYNNVTYSADLIWTDGNFTYGCVCRERNCIRKCCRSDEVLREEPEKQAMCQKMQQNSIGPATAKTPDLQLPPERMSEEIREVDKLLNQFLLMENGLVCSSNMLLLSPVDFPEDSVVLRANGSLVNPDGIVYPVWNYCLDWQVTYDRVGIVVCVTPEIPNETQTVQTIGMIISIPFLVATFLVYAITPELKNLYGKTFMCYVICLITAYVFVVLANFIHMGSIRELCVVTAFVIHFSFLASFFWLNVMCFDIWWTFGGFRSLQGSVKQREKKKFIIYSIYAWGSASILTIICAIMDFVPSVPDYMIRPQFGTDSCWFTTDEAKALYFYGPMGITIVCNICLFISTALKILRHKKDTALHLGGSESRRHDDNKQWFSLYLKLFIVMGINWSMEIVSWLTIKSAPQYIFYLTDLTNALQGLIIFIIFVWKEKIKRLLLRRFGCQDRDFFSRNSTRSGVHSTTSRTCTTSTGVIPLQVKISPYVQANCRTKSSSDETDP